MWMFAVLPDALGAEWLFKGHPRCPAGQKDDAAAAKAPLFKKESIGKVNSSSSRSQLELTIAKIVVEVTLPNFSLTG